MACALLLYAGVVSTSEEALRLFATRRCQPPELQPSELRTIKYMGLMSSGKLPHTKPMILRSLMIQPVPLFTRARDGCRPYIEIYSNGAMIYSTKKIEYEEMKLFNMVENKICLSLADAMVRGDLTMVLYHARQQLGRIIGIKICAWHFHTGFVFLNENFLTFERKDLDDAPDVGGKFRVVLNIKFGEDSAKFSRVPAPWEDSDSPRPVPDPLFGSTLEMDETLECFRTSNSTVNILILIFL